MGAGSVCRKRQSVRQHMLSLMGTTSIAVAAAAGAAAGFGLIHTLIRMGIYSVRNAYQASRKDQKWTSSTCSHEGSRRQDPYDPLPRQGALKWDEYFMSIAFLSSLRSKDPSKQVGACIVGQNKIILGIGYNGFPRGCDDHDLPWAKCSSKGTLGTKYPYVVHAEANALLNTNTSNIAGATIYVTMMPCNNCAKLLIQAGISEVVYFEGKDIGNVPPKSPCKANSSESSTLEQYMAANKLFSLAKVKLRQFQADRPLHIDLWV